MALWIVVVLLALLLFVEGRNMRLLATILFEIRDFLDQQPYRMARYERQEAELREFWASAGDSQGDALSRSSRWPRRWISRGVVGQVRVPVRLRLVLARAV